jgi:hypothetical protein
MPESRNPTTAYIGIGSILHTVRVKALLVRTMRLIAGVGWWLAANTFMLLLEFLLGQKRSVHALFWV